MPRAVKTIRNSIVYDLLLAALYSWSVFEAYTYDAKTRTSGILIYVVVYGGFTLLVRSPLGVLLMNLLSAITLPWVFETPVLQHAGSYFTLQPFLGIAITILVGVVQAGFSVLLLTLGQRFLERPRQYVWSATMAVAFAMVLTMVSTGTPMRP